MTDYKIQPLEWLDTKYTKKELYDKLMEGVEDNKIINVDINKPFSTVNLQEQHYLYLYNSVYGDEWEIIVNISEINQHDTFIITYNEDSFVDGHDYLLFFEEDGYLNIENYYYYEYNDFPENPLPYEDFTAKIKFKNNILYVEIYQNDIYIDRWVYYDINIPISFVGIITNKNNYEIDISLHLKQLYTKYGFLNETVSPYVNIEEMETLTVLNVEDVVKLYNISTEDILYNSKEFILYLNTEFNENEFSFIDFGEEMGLYLGSKNDGIYIIDLQPNEQTEEMDVVFKFKIFDYFNPIIKIKFLKVDEYRYQYYIELNDYVLFDDYISIRNGIDLISFHLNDIESKYIISKIKETDISSKEDVKNKRNNWTFINDIFYPTSKLVKDSLDEKLNIEELNDKLETLIDELITYYDTVEGDG